MSGTRSGSVPCVLTLSNQASKASTARAWIRLLVAVAVLAHPAGHRPPQGLGRARRTGPITIPGPVCLQAAIGQVGPAGQSDGQESSTAPPAAAAVAKHREPSGTERPKGKEVPDGPAVARLKEHGEPWAQQASGSRSRGLARTRRLPLLQQTRKSRSSAGQRFPV